MRARIIGTQFIRGQVVSVTDFQLLGYLNLQHGTKSVSNPVCSAKPEPSKNTNCAVTSAEIGAFGVALTMKYGLNLRILLISNT